MISLSGKQWAFFGSLDMLEYKVMKSLTRGDTALRFLGPEQALGVSRQDLQNRLGRWLVNQHGAQWRGFGVPKDRLKSLSQDPVWVPGQNL